MASTCGKDEHITLAHLQTSAAFASKNEGRRASRNPKSFMGIRMKVVVAIDSLRPLPAPAIAPKRLAEEGLQIIALYNGAIEKDG